MAELVTSTAIPHRSDSESLSLLSSMSQLHSRRSCFQALLLMLAVSRPTVCSQQQAMMMMMMMMLCFRFHSFRFIKQSKEASVDSFQSKLAGTWNVLLWCVVCINLWSRSLAPPSFQHHHGRSLLAVCAVDGGWSSFSVSFVSCELQDVHV